MKRWLSLLPALLLAFPALFSCGETQIPDEIPTTGPESGAETEEPAVSERYDIPEPDLPALDCGGETFWIAGGQNDVFLFAETLIGEVVNDAVFRRNLLVEEQYNLKLKRLAASQEITNLIAAGETMDLIYRDAPGFAATVFSGGYQNLTNIPYLSLEAEYWSPNAFRGLNVDSQVFFLPNEISMDPLSMTSFLYFNKRILNEYDLENPYDLVYGNEWTIDKYLELIRKVPRDLNGDGKMDDQDLFGDIHRYEYRTAAFLQLYFGCGQTYTRPDPDSGRVLAMDGEFTQALIDKLYVVLNDPSICVDHFNNYTDEDYQEYLRLFMEGHGLFLQSEIRAMNVLREMEDDFGIIPNPKFNSDQENYYNRVHPYAGMFAVSVTAPDTERTGIVTEYMAWLSHCTVLPAYYEITIKQKRTRDTDAEEMLDIIRRSMVYEFADVFEVSIANYMWDAYCDRSYARKVLSSEKIIKKRLEKFVKRLRALD
ncbi:MAG: hypothetical protein J5938_06085 [Clostridia bacterium]|nr:hypothetical protein [Clostridia bacterium]